MIMLNDTLHYIASQIQAKLEYSTMPNDYMYYIMTQSSRSLVVLVYRHRHNSIIVWEMIF